MSRYADLDALEKALNERLTFLRECSGNYDPYTDGFDEAVDRVENFPTADVAPVRRGWWEDVASSYWRWTSSGAVTVTRATYRCSRCGRGTIVKTGSCTCGAKMDGGDDNACP